MKQRTLYVGGRKNCECINLKSVVLKVRPLKQQQQAASPTGNLELQIPALHTHLLTPAWGQPTNLMEQAAR